MIFINRLGLIEKAGAGQSLELISLGRQGAINELFSRTGNLEITCVGTTIALRDSRLPLAVSLFPLRAGARWLHR